MLKLAPVSHLSTATSIRLAVDRLASLIEQRRKITLEEEAIKARLREISIDNDNPLIKGNHYQATVSVEWQERIDTPRLRAALRPADLAPFLKPIKVVKVTVAPLTDTPK